MSDALTIDGLTKQYTRFKLDAVSLRLPVGFIMGFVGQNGAGKTTTIRLILNMVKRDAGQVSVLGMDNIADEIAIKQEVAVVFDTLALVDNWRIGVVEKVMAGFYERWDTRAYNNYLMRFDLSPDRKISDLSRGMQLKLAMSIALSHDAKLLILDEPTSGLDPVAREELLDILHEYIEDGDRSVFFSTHITSDLDKVADYITVIDKGRIFYSGVKDGLTDAFVLAKGKLEDLSDDLREKMMGVTASRVGFSGLLPASQVGWLKPSMVADRPDIDEILVHIAKEDRHHGA